MDGQHLAYIALGSNLADREGNLARAVEMLAAIEGGGVMACSRFLSYPAEGSPPGSPDYLNGAVALAATLNPFALWRQMVEIETRMGRPGPKDRPPNVPRVIDMDLLLYDQVVIATAQLVVPHPRMHTRRFVLEPLAQITPDAVHPVFGRTAKEMLERLS
jgi:2-amino-4-hydroxy-6-hydroxymethyldihydropteridine diphosphokinase